MQSRWKLNNEESILAYRLAAITVGATLFAVLPWPADRLLQVGMLAVWVITGLVAFRLVRARGKDEHYLRSVWRLLVFADFGVALVAMVIYSPLFPQVWAGLLVFPIYAAARDRVFGAMAYGLASMVVVSIFHQIGLLGPVAAGEANDADQLLMRLGIIASVTLVTCGTCRVIDMGADTLVQQQAALREAERQQADLARVASSRALTMERVIELGVVLLREHDIASLLDRILDATLQTFGFEAGVIFVNERENNRFVVGAFKGYHGSVAEHVLKRTLSFPEMQVRLDRRFEVRPGVLYAPVERQTWRGDPNLLKYKDRADEQRLSSAQWHEADSLMFPLRSSSGEMIGLMTVDAPIDRRVPGDATLDTLALFSSLAGAAIENLYGASDAHPGASASLGFVRAEAEQRRLKASRAARILEVAASLREERDLDALLRRILDLTIDMFNFNAGTIALYDPTRRVFQRRCVLGYPSELEGEAIPQSTIDRMMNARTRVTDRFYWVPMELRVPGGVSRNPARAQLPRDRDGVWHEDDLMLFPFFDSEHQMLGILSPDDPKDGRVPDDETVRAIEGFAQLAAAAVEIAHMRGRASRRDVAGPA